MFSGNRPLQAITLLGLLSLSACADHMNNRDSITLGAGNATAANMGIHTVEPFPTSAHDTTIHVSPEKTEQARERYLIPCDPDVVTCGDSGEYSVTTSE